MAKKKKVTAKKKKSLAKSYAASALERDRSMRSAIAESSLFEKLKSGLKTVTIDDQELFVAEGDTLLDEDQLMIYANSREKENQARDAAAFADAGGLGVAELVASARGLVANTQGGRITRWAPGTVLSYRVVRDTFTSASRYNQVVESMRAATEEWENTCGVEFQHREALDKRPGVGPAGALFTVRFINANGAFIAAAFFPNDPIGRRRVLIDPSYFTTSFDSVGVLRHELGHVLGFRHEHIRSGAPAACPDEPLFDTQNLTAYDPQSVMHYFCGGVGSRELRISSLDRQGAQMVYGPPLSQLELISA